MLATVKTTGTQTYLTDFKTGKTLATYRNGKTTDVSRNQTVNGNQLMRFVKG